MHADDGLTSTFDAERPRLHQMAFRMLGSVDDADDALQRAWLRAASADRTGVRSLPAWLTTVTARVCYDALRARRRRAERPLPEEPGGTGGGGRPPSSDGAPAGDPEDDAVMAESVGRALLVVLDRLSPAQRVAFVLHDVFALPFEDVGQVVERSPAAAKKLASRARARVRGATDGAEPPERADHRAVVEAFLTASRGGDIAALMELLAPDVVRRTDRVAVPAGTPSIVRGATAVAEETRVFGARARIAEVALVDGRPGIVVAPAGRLVTALRLTVADGRITEIDVVAEPSRLAAISLAVPPT